MTSPPDDEDKLDQLMIVANFDELPLDAQLSLENQENYLSEVNSAGDSSPVDSVVSPAADDSSLLKSSPVDSNSGESSPAESTFMESSSVDSITAELPTDESVEPPPDDSTSAESSTTPVVTQAETAELPVVSTTAVVSQAETAELPVVSATAVVSQAETAEPPAVSATPVVTQAETAELPVVSATPVVTQAETAEPPAVKSIPLWLSQAETTELPVVTSTPAWLSQTETAELPVLKSTPADESHGDSAKSLPVDSITAEASPVDSTNSALSSPESNPGDSSPVQTTTVAVEPAAPSMHEKVEDEQSSGSVVPERSEASVSDSTLIASKPDLKWSEIVSDEFKFEATEVAARKVEDPDSLERPIDRDESAGLSKEPGSDADEYAGSYPFSEKPQYGTLLSRSESNGTDTLEAPSEQPQQGLSQAESCGDDFSQTELSAPEMPPPPPESFRRSNSTEPPPPIVIGTPPQPPPYILTQLLEPEAEPVAEEDDEAEKLSLQSGKKSEEEAKRIKETSGIIRTSMPIDDLIARDELSPQDYKSRIIVYTAVILSLIGLVVLPGLLTKPPASTPLDNPKPVVVASKVENNASPVSSPQGAAPNHGPASSEDQNKNANNEANVVKEDHYSPGNPNPVGVPFAKPAAPPVRNKDLRFARARLTRMIHDAEARGIDTSLQKQLLRDIDARRGSGGEDLVSRLESMSDGLLASINEQSARQPFDASSQPAAVSYQPNFSAQKSCLQIAINEAKKQHIDTVKARSALRNVQLDINYREHHKEYANQMESMTNDLVDKLNQNEWKMMKEANRNKQPSKKQNAP